MNRLMRWKRVEGNTENPSNLVLEMTEDGLNWYHYANPKLAKYRQPDSNMKGASKGFNTAAHCLKLGFTYLPTDN